MFQYKNTSILIIKHEYSNRKYKYFKTKIQLSYIDKNMNISIKNTNISIKITNISIRNTNIYFNIK